MERIGIGEVATRSGLSTSALRYYESAGLLRGIVRVRGRRTYDTAVLDQLAVIRLAQDVGCTIAEIRTLMQGFTRSTRPSERFHALARAKLTEVGRMIAQAERMEKVLRRAASCRCERLTDCAASWEAARRAATV